MKADLILPHSWLGIEILRIKEVISKIHGFLKSVGLSMQGVLQVSRYFLSEEFKSRLLGSVGFC